MDNTELQNISVGEFLRWLLRRRWRFRVTGNSMLPLLKPDDEVLVDPWAYRHKLPQPGDLVIAQHPYRRETRLIKRITALTEDNRYFVAGDNPAESTDSRSFGPLALEEILGRVTCRFT